MMLFTCGFHHMQISKRRTEKRAVLLRRSTENKNLVKFPATLYSVYETMDVALNKQC